MEKLARLESANLGLTYSIAVCHKCDVRINKKKYTCTEREKEVQQQWVGDMIWWQCDLDFELPY